MLKWLALGVGSFLGFKYLFPSKKQTEGLRLYNLMATAAAVDPNTQGMQYVVEVVPNWTNHPGWNPYVEVAYPSGEELSARAYFNDFAVPADAAVFLLDLHTKLVLASKS